MCAKICKDSAEQAQADVDGSNAYPPFRNHRARHFLEESIFGELPLYQKKLHAQKNYLGINFQKCVMTFRVIDYTEKCLGELIAEELHRTLSHISCTSSICCVFWGVGRPQIRINLLRTQVPKMHMANLGIFWVVWFPGAQKRWKT